jgi:uncharacterized protein YndB with AHSA1/START domain
MNISITVAIKNTPEKVFYWLEDPSRAMKWMMSVSKTEIIRQTPGMVGTTFREIVQEDGRGTEMRGVVTEFVPGKRLAFHLDGDYNAVEVRYTLEEQGEHTRLSQTAEIHFKGLLRAFSILFGPLFKRKIMNQARSDFARLKALCEQDG